MAVAINGLGLAAPHLLATAAITQRVFALAAKAPATELLSKFGKLENSKITTATLP